MSPRRISSLTLALLLWLAPPAEAQTRVYFDSVAAASQSPAFGAGWQVTSAAVRRRMNTTKQSSASTASANLTSTATNPELHLALQAVKCELDAQTIDGSIKGQMEAIQNSTAYNGTLAIRVAKSDSAGNNVVEILAISASDATTVPPEFTTSEQNRRFMDAAEATSLTLTSTTINSGDCLIIEIGVRDNNNSATNFSNLRWGDDHASDLPEDETTTTNNNPWVEFTDTITFGGTPPAATNHKNCLLLRVCD